MEEQPEQADTAPAPPVSGVFVFTRETAGGVAVVLDLVGGYDPLAAPALLEIATLHARTRVGLGPKPPQGSL